MTIGLASTLVAQPTVAALGSAFRAEVVEGLSAKHRESPPGGSATSRALSYSRESPDFLITIRRVPSVAPSRRTLQILLA
jgi:hypothetical protein